VIESISNAQASTEVSQTSELKSKREALQARLLQQLNQQQMIQLENQRQGKGLNLDILV